MTISGWRSLNARWDAGITIAQPMYLLQCDFLQVMRCVRPMERIAVQPFHQDQKSSPVPLEDPDQCTSAIAEREHTTGVRIEMEF